MAKKNVKEVKVNYQVDVDFYEEEKVFVANKRIEFYVDKLNEMEKALLIGVIKKVAEDWELIDDGKNDVISIEDEEEIVYDVVEYVNKLAWDLYMKTNEIVELFKKEVRMIDEIKKLVDNTIIGELSFRFEV